MATGINFLDIDQIVWGFGPALPSTSTSTIISLKDVLAVEVVLIGLNATTVTGSAITLNQCSAVAGTGSKALAFTDYFSNIAPATTPNMVKNTAVSNTFTTVATNSLKFVYRIPIDPATLDINNGFDCLQVALATGVATSIAAFFHLKTKYGGNYLKVPNVFLD